MKVAQLFITAKLPDDFVGGPDEVLRYIADLPTKAAPLTDVPSEHRPTRGAAFHALTVASWPAFLAAVDKGRTATMLVVGTHYEGQVWTKLDPMTFQPEENLRAPEDGLPIETPELELRGGNRIPMSTATCLRCFEEVLPAQVHRCREDQP